MAADAVLFSGSSNSLLAQEIAALLKTSLGKVDLRSFPDQEISVQILESVQQRRVFVIQSLFPDPNKYLMELLIMLDALKRAAAASITVVLPYYGYARQDRLDKPGVSITAKLLADLLTKAGATRLLTMDLHSEQIEGFFDIPIQQVLSRQLLIPYCASLNLENVVIVAPDKGGIKIASDYARQLNAPMALVDKERINAFQVGMHLFVGDVQGKTVLISDDMCSTGGTLMHAAQICAQLGAKRIIAVVGHGLFIGNALKNLEESPIEMLIVTNSISLSEEARLHPKVRIVSVASLFAQAIN